MEVKRPRMVYVLSAIGTIVFLIAISFTVSNNALNININNFSLNSNIVLKTTNIFWEVIILTALISLIRFEENKFLKNILTVYGFLRLLNIFDMIILVFFKGDYNLLFKLSLILIFIYLGISIVFMIRIINNFKNYAILKSILRDSIIVFIPFLILIYTNLEPIFISQYVLDIMYESSTTLGIYLKLRHLASAINSFSIVFLFMTSFYFKRYIKTTSLLIIELLLKNLTYYVLYNIPHIAELNIMLFQMSIIKYISYIILIFSIYFYYNENNKKLKIKNSYSMYKYTHNILPSVFIASSPILFLLIHVYLYIKYNIILDIGTYIEISIISIFSIILRNIYIRKENKMLIKELRTVSKKDALTGIYNASAFEKRVALWNNDYTLFFLDIQNFKDVNDTYGHTLGDEVLKYVANFLKNLYKGENIERAYCRYGGDEFLYAIRATDEKIIKTISELMCVSKKMYDDKRKIEVLFHLNVGYHISRNESFEEVLNKSDFAMYDAKLNKRNLAVKYSDEIKEKYLRLKILKKDLTTAMENDKINVVFQPKIFAKNKEIKGFETLARWTHETEGVVPPPIFIKLAEECGKIYNLDLYIFKKACEFQKRLENMNIENTCSVNFSIQTLKEFNIVNDIKNIIENYGIKKENIILEILENVALDENKMVINHIEELRKIGVKISIDDFGTEYSSLNRIAQVPFNELKIPKEFIDIIYSERQLKVLQSVIFMSELLDTDTVIEGVETKYQYDLFKELGFNLIQGYYFSKPLKDDDYINWVNNYKRS